jgi:hypothetical protein
MEPQAGTDNRALAEVRKAPSRKEYLDHIAAELFVNHNRDFVTLVSKSLEIALSDHLSITDKTDFLSALVKIQLPDVPIDQADISFTPNGVRIKHNGKTHSRKYTEQVSQILNTSSPTGFEDLNRALLTAGIISRSLRLDNLYNPTGAGLKPEDLTPVMNLSTGNYFYKSQLETIAEEALSNEEDLSKLQEVGGVLCSPIGFLCVSKNLDQIEALPYSKEFINRLSGYHLLLNSKTQNKLITEAVWATYENIGQLQILENPLKAAIESRFDVQIVAPHGKASLEFSDQELQIIMSFLECTQETAVKMLKTIRKADKDPSWRYDELSPSDVANRRVLGLISVEAGRQGLGMSTRIHPKGNSFDLELDPADFSGFESNGVRYSLFRLGYLAQHYCRKMNADDLKGFADNFMANFGQAKEMFQTLGGSEMLASNILIRRFVQSVMIYQQEKNIGQHQKLEPHQVSYFDSLFGNQDPETFPKIELLDQ